jgi:dienelactone hydrolase
MTFQSFIGICTVAVALGISSCNSEEKTEPETKTTGTPAIKEENVTYTADGVTMNGYIAYDSSNMEKRPVVLVVHEWWGQNDYPRMRAKQLAGLGYLAMAVDMYGNGQTADNPVDAAKLSDPFYKDQAMAKTRFDAALAKIKTYPQAGDKIAAIGYCFGGSMVLNMAKLGDDLAGVVSFHGVLKGNPPADKNLLKAKILVCHGAADQFTPQADIDVFRKQLDSIQANYTFKVYPDATHAFTNPAATEAGKKFNIPIAYNAAADTASWNDMKTFFGTIFK